MSSSAGLLAVVAAPLMILLGTATLGGVLTLVGGTLGLLASAALVFVVILYVVGSVARSVRYDPTVRY